MKKHDESVIKLDVSGLDNFSFAETSLSHVDGEKGELVVCGYSIEDLGSSISFEALCHLLLRGFLPDTIQLEAYREKIGQARVDAFPLIESIKIIPKNGMDYLRAALASIEVDVEQTEGAERMIGAMAVAAAAWNRLRLGLSLIPPDPSLNHGEDFLRMALGSPGDPHLVSALDSYLVTVADHGMNASTFAARVVASTGSDLASSVVAGIGALKGPLHGGAPGPVLGMLESIEKPENARLWLEGELKAGRRIMGMGHRIYRVRDPRAAVLEQATLRLENSGIKSIRLSLARAVEKAASQLLSERYPDRPLKANVEFYTAVLLDSIGLPAELFSPTFAVGRVAGWCAHVCEQRRYGKLIRPQSCYVGPFGLKL